LPKRPQANFCGLFPRTGFLILVPRRNAIESKRRDNHRRGIEANAGAAYREVDPDHVPVLTGAGVGFEVFEAFVQHLSVPVRYGNLIMASRRANHADIQTGAVINSLEFRARHSSRQACGTLML
jgi:hypothetical protein